MVVGPGLVEVVVAQGAERLHEGFFAVVAAVEPLGHGVAAPMLFEEPARAHLDACFQRHKVIGVLDPPIAPEVVEFLVAVARDAVELEEPICG